MRRGAMEYTIERVKLGDEAILAYIQTESWKAGFKDILDPDTLQRCTQIDKATAMYRRLLEQNVGNGYLLKVDGAPHCIAWWDATREKDMPGYAELICIHSLPNQWRKGYGSKMMNAVLRDITTAGYSKITSGSAPKSSAYTLHYSYRGNLMDFMPTLLQIL